MPLEYKSKYPRTWFVIDIRLICRLLICRLNFLLALTEEQGKGIALTFLNSICVIHQDLVEYVDDHKRSQEYSYLLVYFAVFSTSRLGFHELEVIRAW